MVQGSSVTPDLPGWAELVLLPVAGVIAKHLWDRYRGRLTTLRWTVTYQAMAFATDDFGWGKVELLYNGAPARNLHMAYVQLQNASSRDLTNVRVDLVADEQTIVLRSAGTLRGGANEFPFASDYARVLGLSSEGKLDDSTRAFWLRRSPFTVPILNRGATADFKLLVGRPDYATPSVSLDIEHQGVRILHQPPVEETWGVRVGQAVAVGVVAGLAVSYGALRLGMPTGWLVFLAWFAGACAQHVGAAIVRTWRALLAVAD